MSVLLILNTVAILGILVMLFIMRGWLMNLENSDKYIYEKAKTNDSNDSSLEFKHNALAADFEKFKKDSSLESKHNALAADFEKFKKDSSLEFKHNALAADFEKFKKDSIDTFILMDKGQFSPGSPMKDMPRMVYGIANFLQTKFPDFR